LFEGFDGRWGLFHDDQAGVSESLDVGVGCLASVKLGTMSDRL